MFYTPLEVLLVRNEDAYIRTYTDQNLGAKEREKKPIVLIQLTTSRITNLMLHLKAVVTHSCDEHNR